MTVYIHSMLKPVTQPDPLDPAHPARAAKGRGTVWAIEHRFSARSSESFDDGWGTLEQHAHEQHLPERTQVIEEQAKAILASNDSPTSDGARLDATHILSAGWSW